MARTEAPRVIPVQYWPIGHCTEPDCRYECPEFKQARPGDPRRLCICGCEQRRHALVEIVQGTIVS